LMTYMIFTSYFRKTVLPCTITRITAQAGYSLMCLKTSPSYCHPRPTSFLFYFRFRFNLLRSLERFHYQQPT